MKVNVHSSSSTSGLAYDTMKNVITPATPRAASIGTSRIAGVPNNPANRSDKTLAGSKVAAESSIEEDCVAGMNDGKDVKAGDANAPSAKGPGKEGRADNFVLDPAAAKAPANGPLVAKRGAGENASHCVMTAPSWTTKISNNTCSNGFIRS